MPTKAKPLRVFIASPGDVKNERKLAFDALASINSQNPDTFQVVGWENSTFPDAGDDAQSVINSQIDWQTIDILIAIMWSRLGTPTLREKSGTAEEIKILLRQKKEFKRNVKIMVYFKNDAVPIEAIDPDQIKRLREFRNELTEEGVYHWNISESTFQSELLAHLELILAQGGREAIFERGVADTLRRGFDLGTSALMDKGFLNAIEDGRIALENARLLMRTTSEAIESFYSAMEIRKRMNFQAFSAISQRDDAAFRLLKLAKLRQSLDAASSGLWDNFQTALANAAIAVQISIEDKIVRPKFIIEMLDTIRGGATVFLSNSEKTSTLSKIIADTPRITTELTRERRLTLESVMRLAETWDALGRKIILFDELTRPLLTERC